MPEQSLKDLYRPTLEGLRTYWPAMVAIQFAALLTVLAYYFVDGTATFFARVAIVQEKGGLLFVAVCTVISGGVIPEILKRIYKREDRSPPGLGELANQFMMWAGLGILIERFYALQDFVFGPTDSVGILLVKVFFDQLVFAPLITMPYTVGLFMLYESRYKMKTWLRGVTLQTWKRRALPLWMTCLSFWPVMLLIVYCLPRILQFPLFLFANSAYGILMVFIARRQISHPDQTGRRS